MTCTLQFRAALYVVYIASVVMALANPADFNFEHAYQLTQGANIITLILLAYCKRSIGDAFVAAVLAAAFAFRATDSWRGGSRWDSLLVTIGMLFIFKDGFYQILPKWVPHKFVLYLVFSCIVLPVLFAIPHVVRRPAIDTQSLLLALQLSADAYSPREERAHRHTTVFSDDTDTDAGVTRVRNAEGTRDIYVYFRGSESQKDWKTNINILGDAIPQDWGCKFGPVMRTHQGYTKAFSSIASKMEDVVVQFAQQPGNRRIVFCGHSMGGALATMAGLYVACKQPSLRPHIAVVTFGAPQVGDGNFVEFFNTTIPTSMRIVNPNDPVPRLLNAQLVHVKGYYPVGSLSLDTLLKAHETSTYKAALEHSRVVSIAAAFLPAVIAATAIAAYVAWQVHGKA